MAANNTFNFVPFAVGSQVTAKEIKAASDNYNLQLAGVVEFTVLAVTKPVLPILKLSS